ncbi:MAG: class I SAM-dependent methyltransferase [Sphingomonas sp.]|uniref:class I SAM-dependent methyltransferase n=1 Tax=Sphingomonas sp. TaxID=28214 RepID=UPI003F809AA5
MHESNTEAERWERGCKTDSTRNLFIVPTLVRHFEREKPQTILDIGAGTGYVARVSDGRLSYRPAWTLIDKNRSRLDLAAELSPHNMAADLVEADVLDYRFKRPFEAVVATFTILEIADADGFIEVVSSLVVDGGVLLVAVPDAWPDVLKCGEAQPEVISQFLGGAVAIPKVDKFTGDSYPFRTVRLEKLISRILSAGFELFELSEDFNAGSDAYILAFRRRSSIP